MHILSQVDEHRDPTVTAGWRELWFRVVVLTVSCALMVVLFELSVWVLVSTKSISVPAPMAAPPAGWDSDHLVFGAWHTPSTRHTVGTAVFEVEYAINSVGARDVERPQAGPPSRVVVLGDSVTEGWGSRSRSA